MGNVSPFKVEASFLVSRTDDVGGIAHAEVVLTHTLKAGARNVQEAIAALDQLAARVTSDLNRLATL